MGSDFIKISVSFLKSKFDSITTIKKINDTDAVYLHVDVMDGKFVSNSTGDLINVIKNTNKKLDIHLMVENPIKYIDLYKELNPEFITIHLELNTDLDEIIDYIRKCNIKVGIAIKPKTDISNIYSYLNKIDQVLVMSVEPGEGGQSFLESSILKIAQLDLIKRTQHYNYEINVDGGINDKTAKLVTKANATMCVSGSFICMSDNYQEQIDKLK